MVFCTTRLCKERESIKINSNERVGGVAKDWESSVFPALERDNLVAKVLQSKGNGCRCDLNVEDCLAHRRGAIESDTNDVRQEHGNGFGVSGVDRVGEACGQPQVVDTLVRSEDFCKLGFLLTHAENLPTRLFCPQNRFEHEEAQVQPSDCESSDGRHFGES